MIIPTKYENLKKNSFVVGYNIILILKEQQLTLLDLHQKLCKLKNLDLDLAELTDTLTFLFLCDIIELDNDLIRLTNDIK